MDNIAGKVVLISGASGDIGFALAKNFINNNNIVICQYNNNKVQLEKLQQEYAKQVYLLKSDFNKPETIETFWHEVLIINRPIDIVINASGIMQEDLSLNQIQKNINVNYLSPRLICDYAIDYFKQNNKTGIIINIGSRAAYRGLQKGYYTYADAKAALTKYSQEIAKENAKDKISVYIIAPGPVEGKMFQGLMEKAKVQNLGSVPTGKLVTTQEIVAVVNLLASGQVPSATGGVFDLMGASWAH